jgi:hypothetical protein
MEELHFDIEEELFGVDHDRPYIHKTCIEVEVTYLQKVKKFLPMWEAWLVKNLDLLSKFEQWEPVADRKIVAAGYGLQKAIQEKSEAALNNAHDLWCVKQWIEGSENVDNNLVESLEGLHGIRSDVIQHMMQRLARICELENHPYLDDAAPLALSNNDWMDKFKASRWGRSVVRDLEFDEVSRQIATPVCDISWLPQEDVYSEYVKSITEASDESLANHQRRQMFELLHEIVLESPFRRFMLIHSQVKGVLTDRRAVFVRDPGEIGNGN